MPQAFEDGGSVIAMATALRRTGSRR